jgi:tetratricopeptide (TPR) repeat protein
LVAAQQPEPAESVKAAEQAPASVGAADHSKAYYHFMLARRYKELAGMYNRGDYIDRAIGEYKQAMAADPDSLFLHVELAELYAQVGRGDDSVHEAEAVLKIDPDYPDAHRLLADIYLHLLDTTQADANATKENLSQAIAHLEALVRVDPNDTDSWLKLGRLYRATNQPSRAEETFRKVLKTDPGSKVGLANLAELYIQQGDYDRAAEALSQIPEDEMDSQLLGMLAYAYSQTHHFDKAVATYEKALAEDPDNAELHHYYADALLNAGKMDAARVELQKTLKSGSEDGPTYLRLAQIDRQEGRFDEARQELEKAKALLPDKQEALYEQALLEDTLGNDDKAVQILQGLVKQSERPQGKYTASEASNRAIFLEHLGLAYREQEKFPQAMETFQQIQGLGKSQGPLAELLIIETLHLERQTDKALAEAEAAIQTYPQDRSLKIQRATLLGEKGRVDEAVAQLQGMLSQGPSDREVYLSIAQVYEQAKRYTDAEQAVRKSLEMTPHADDQRPALFILGSIYERQKKYDLAEEAFKKVLAADPLDASAANYLGYMLADRGVRLEESVKYIKQALEIEPNNAAYLDSLGWAYFKMARYDLAAPHLEKAARKIQNDPTIHEHLGNLYLRMGKPALAREQWERALKEWPQATSSDFDAEEASELQKQLDQLNGRLAHDKSAQK